MPLCRPWTPARSLTDNHTFTASDGSTQVVTITINGAEDTPGDRRHHHRHRHRGRHAHCQRRRFDHQRRRHLGQPYQRSKTKPRRRATTATATSSLTAGAWTYTLNNAHAAVQALDAGESLTDIHTFTASDGSTQVVTITINGAEDAPVIGGTTTGNCSRGRHAHRQRRL